MAQINNEGTREQALRIAARVESHINQLARATVERLRAEIPDLDRVPPEVHDLETAPTVRHVIRFFLQHVQRSPTAEPDASFFRERAAQRAKEGVALAALLRAYHIGSEVLVNELNDVARPGEESALLLLTRWQHTVINYLIEQITEAYLAGLADNDVDVRGLARALLGGEEPDAAAERCGLTIEPGYRVLSVRSHRAIPPIAARRLLRQVLARLSPLAAQRFPYLPDEHGGHILLPVGITHVDVASRLDRGLAQQLIIGVALARTPQDVPAAAEQATRIVRLVTTPGVYQLCDVLLDYHLARPDDSAAELRTHLTRLEGQPGLIETLRTFLEMDLDRLRTARALAVHPNTVHNRLARILELTGVNPRTTYGVQLFGAALTLDRLRNALHSAEWRANPNT